MLIGEDRGRDHDQARNKSDQSFKSCPYSHSAILPLRIHAARAENPSTSCLYFAVTLQNEIYEIPAEQLNLTLCSCASKTELEIYTAGFHLKRSWFPSWNQQEWMHRWLSPLSETSKVPTQETRGKSSWITPPPADLNCWERDRETETWRNVTSIADSVCLRRRWARVSRQSVPHSCWCPGVSRWYEGYWTDPGRGPWGWGEKNTDRVGTGD